MPLQPVTTSESTAAELLAQRVVNNIKQVTNEVNKLRTEGVPARPAREEQIVNGRVIPAFAGTPAITPQAFNEALGETNCALFDALRVAIFGE
jgi:hypothetical protein